MALNVSDDLIIQSFFTVQLLEELSKNNFLSSEYYQKMKFQDSFVHSNLPSIGIGNRGTMLMMLYSLLVLNKSVLQDDFKVEFESLNLETDNKLSTRPSTDYKSDVVCVDYVRHIRNSVAHGNVNFKENDVIFLDEDKRNKSQCTIIMNLREVGEFLTGLKHIFYKFVEKRQSQ